jgi:hypothetical protein
MDWEVDGWLLPFGWTPAWSAERGKPRLANGPDVWFEYLQSVFWSSRTRATSPVSVPIKSDDEQLRLCSAWYRSFYFPWETKCERFAKRCKSIFRRHTTTRYVQVDKEANRIRDISARETANDCRIGFHALEWARAHPRHYVREDLKPVDWVPPESKSR